MNTGWLQGLSSAAPAPGQPLYGSSALHAASRVESSPTRGNKRQVEYGLAGIPGYYPGIPVPGTQACVSVSSLASLLVPTTAAARGAGAAMEATAPAEEWEQAPFSGAERASFLPPVKPSFRTQAGALMLKNLRYQQKNW